APERARGGRDRRRLAEGRGGAGAPLRGPAEASEEPAGSVMAAAPGDDVYTDAPRLHPGGLVAALQLFAWVIFRPTAWRRHGARIDPTLRADFYLAELTPARWRNPQLLRLLFIGHLVWPLVSGVILGAIYLLVRRVTFEEAARRLFEGVVLGVVGGVALGL